MSVCSASLRVSQPCVCLDILTFVSHSNGSHPTNERASRGGPVFVPSESSATETRRECNQISSLGPTSTITLGRRDQMLEKAIELLRQQAQSAKLGANLVVFARGRSQY